MKPRFVVIEGQRHHVTRGIKAVRMQRLFDQIANEQQKLLLLGYRQRELLRKLSQHLEALGKLSRKPRRDR